MELLNEIWGQDRIFTNYLLPQQKLITKQRRGAKVIKKHDEPTTPHQRAIADPAVRKRPIITMNAAFKRIKPTALQREIMTMTGQLESMSLAKKTGPSKPGITIAKHG